jgi:hypothetical protein
MNENRRCLLAFLAGTAIGVAGAIPMARILVANATADELSSVGLLPAATAARILGEAQRMVVITPSRMRQDAEAKQVVLSPADIAIIVDRASGCQYLVVSSPQLPSGTGRAPDPIALGLRWDAHGRPMCGDPAIMEKRVGP